MSSKPARAEQQYRERVARVVAYIVANPLAAHRLDDLAALAHFSPFHFHRVYCAVAGESVAATVRRVRLAQAAQLLEQGQCSVTEVALAVGYDSPQAFTRAFGQFTGQSPRAFQHDMHRVALKGRDSHTDSSSAYSPTMLEVTLVERPAQHVQALRHVGPAATIAHTQRQLYLQRGACATARLGAAFGDPDDPTGFRYYAAAAVASDAPPPDCRLEMLHIPAGLYARHTLHGPYTRINAALAALHRRWLPASGSEPDDRPVLEHYLNSPRDAALEALRTDLLIPIRPAGHSA